MSEISFPKDFVWGSATASYQVEGAFDVDGRGESIWDRFSKTPGKVREGHTGDVACDHYNRYVEDVQLMQHIGLKAYRFSIAWPRVFPEKTGKLNPKGFDFYNRLVDNLLEKNIVPWATLYHWDLPQYLEDKGGWRNRDTALAFEEYAHRVGEALSDRVSQWMTLNEPWCSSVLGYQRGEHAPGAKEDIKTVKQIIHHLLLAHGLGTRALRQESKLENPEIGFVHNPYMYVPATDSPQDFMAAIKAIQAESGWWMDPLFYGRYPKADLEELGKNAPDVADGDMEIISQPMDFMGLNIYHAHLTKAADNKKGFELQDYPPDIKRTTMGWPITPEVIHMGLTWMHQIYNPAKIYITENGCAMPDEVNSVGQVMDLDRLQYLHDHFLMAHKAISEGVPLKGYFVWSLLDNFEWAKGYGQRFGITYVDYPTQKRIIKYSGNWYRKVIEANGFKLQEFKEILT